MKLNPFEMKLLAEIALASKSCGSNETRKALEKAYKENALTDEIVMKAVPNAYRGVIAEKEKLEKQKGARVMVNEPVFLYFRGHNLGLDKTINSLREQIKTEKNPLKKKILKKAVRDFEMCKLRVEKKGNVSVLMHGKGVIKKVPGVMGPSSLLSNKKKKRSR